MQADTYKLVVFLVRVAITVLKCAMTSYTEESCVPFPTYNVDNRKRFAYFKDCNGPSVLKQRSEFSKSLEEDHWQMF